MASKKAPPPETTEPKQKSASQPSPASDEFDIQAFEAFLREGIAPDAYQTVPVLCRLFRCLVADAAKRKVVDDVLYDVINHAFDMHTILTLLSDASELRERLKKRGEPTPNLDKTIQAHIQAIKAHRAWAIEYLDKVKQCPLPGTPIH